MEMEISKTSSLDKSESLSSLKEVITEVQLLLDSDAPIEVIERVANVLSTQLNAYKSERLAATRELDIIKNQVMMPEKAAEDTLNKVSVLKQAINTHLFTSFIEESGLSEAFRLSLKLKDALENDLNEVDCFTLKELKQANRELAQATSELPYLKFNTIYMVEDWGSVPKEVLVLDSKKVKEFIATNNRLPEGVFAFKNIEIQPQPKANESK